jgi:selenocysteine-specific elongation factor
VFVIGTAGHVDHGKSTLVQALTGINPDRLREEREREMTIDLGFAWLKLPGGREVSIVDVPGHEDFIKNMLAGIGGIDVALLVVAADEAVMPQTREHLAIIDLLEIPRGVVALTKSDLIDDPEWLELVQEEVREELTGTVLQNAAVIPVSAVTGFGLTTLLEELDRLMDLATPRRDIGRPRLPIDRVFTIPGFGTIVTGTLMDGRLAVGDDVRVVPGDLTARIRGLQTHRQAEQSAEPGARVAANLSGVSVDDLRRGQVVIHPGQLEPTSLLDARLRLLPDLTRPLKHNALVEFFCGAARAEAHVRLLDADALEPGQEGWVQFRLAQPMAMVRDDHYIIRLFSPSMTLGGGRVVQPSPRRRHRRFQPDVLARLDALLMGEPDDVLLQILAQEKILEARDLIHRSNMPEDISVEALSTLLRDGRAVLLTDKAPDARTLPRSAVGVLTRDTRDDLFAQIERVLSAYHQRYPLRRGMPREELKSRVRIETRFFNALVEHAVSEGHLALTATAVGLAGHQVRLSAAEQRAVDGVLAEFARNPHMPPSQSQVEEALGADLLQVLLDEGRLIRVAEGVLFDAGTYQAMQERLVQYLHENEQVAVAQVRDLFDTSRKYAVAFLEDMDRRQVTKRLGDIRVLR